MAGRLGGANGGKGGGVGDCGGAAGGVGGGTCGGTGGVAGKGGGLGGEGSIAFDSTKLTEYSRHSKSFATALAIELVADWLSVANAKVASLSEWMTEVAVTRLD